ncbi:MAG: methyltransferase family protein [Gemmatimonadaceae bacterium]
MRSTAFTLVRAITYSALFIGFLLIFLPARVLEWSGLVRPAQVGAVQIAGMLVGGFGAVVAVWCILTFSTIGRGTPAPFDPPRRLVVAGPYRFVRNPMYIGAALALAGAALSYQSWALAGYAGLFLLVMHLFVVLYEESALKETFGPEYARYCATVKRWWPAAGRS